MKLAFIRTGILSCNILMVLGGVASAAEPAQHGVPFLSKIPYVCQLFKKAGSAPDCGKADVNASPKLIPRQIRIVGTNGPQPIGVDFAFQVVSANGPCCEEECVAAKCEAGCAATKCPGEGATCVEDCDAECNSEAAVSESLLMANRNAIHEREVELLGELFEARLEAAVAQTRLKAQHKATAKEAKLQEALMAAKLENARLQANLELAEEKQKLVTELHEARLELAALKANSDPAAAKLARPSGSRGAGEASR